MIPVWEGRREIGLPLYGCVLLWIWSLARLRKPAAATTAIEQSPARARAA
jgi:hypothetical protein